MANNETPDLASRAMAHGEEVPYGAVRLRNVLSGEFVWHKHDETDDFFLVLNGHLTIQLRDRNIELDEGELFVVPRGVEHCPLASEEAHVLLIEPVGTPNTGDAGGPLTAEKDEL